MFGRSPLVLHQKLAFPTIRRYPVPILSPNGESILVSFYLTIHLWHTKDPILSSGPTQVINQEGFILGISPSEASAAYVRYGGNTVTILDLQSGDTQLTIDAGMRVECLGMTESAIVVVGKEKVVTWNLAAGNARVDINDSVRIATFDPPRVRRQFVSMSVSPDLSRIVTSEYIPGPMSIVLEIYDKIMYPWLCHGG